MIISIKLKEFQLNLQEKKIKLPFIDRQKVEIHVRKLLKMNDKAINQQQEQMIRIKTDSLMKKFQEELHTKTKIYKSMLMMNHESQSEDQGQDRNEEKNKNEQKELYDPSQDSYDSQEDLQSSQSQETLVKHQQSFETFYKEQQGDLDITQNGHSEVKESESNKCLNRNCYQDTKQSSQHDYYKSDCAKVTDFDLVTKNQRKSGTQSINCLSLEIQRRNLTKKQVLKQKIAQKNWQKGSDPKSKELNTLSASTPKIVKMKMFTDVSFNQQQDEDILYEIEFDNDERKFLRTSQIFKDNKVLYQWAKFKQRSQLLRKRDHQKRQDKKQNYTEE